MQVASLASQGRERQGEISVHVWCMVSSFGEQAKKMVSTMSSRGGQVFPSVQVIQACMSLHWSVKVASGKARIVSMSRACCC